MTDRVAPTITVNREALYQLLMAVNGPGHLIRELQATRGPLFPDNPITVLITQFNAEAEAADGSTNDQ